MTRNLDSIMRYFLSLLTFFSLAAGSGCGQIDATPAGAVESAEAVSSAGQIATADTVSTPHPVEKAVAGTVPSSKAPVVEADTKTLSRSRIDREIVATEDAARFDRLGQVGTEIAQSDGKITDAIGIRFVKAGDPIYIEPGEEQSMSMNAHPPVLQSSAPFNSWVYMTQTLNCRSCPSTGCPSRGPLAQNNWVQTSAYTYGQCVSAYGRRGNGWFLSSAWGCWFWSGGTNNFFGPC